MPVKKSATKSAVKPKAEPVAESKTSKASNAFSKINVVWILVILVILAAFLIGVLVTKVYYLENGVAKVAPSAGNEFLGNDPEPQAPSGPVDVAVGGLPALGDKDAPVTLIEFSDFECPFCAALYNDTLPQIKKEYIDTGKAKLYYRHYPLSSIHANANITALASECANDQGKFWDYHDTLFENQDEWISLSGTDINDKLGEYAGTLGLDVSEFNECVTSEKFTDNINEDLNDGSAAGVDGTPAVFINGYLTVGAVPFEQFAAEIDARLEE